MKKSRIAKFALLGASAAALAATLSTSTYAWYVSNQKAFVEDGTGTTGTAGSDGSILVSWQSSASSDQWFKTISFDDVPSASSTSGALQPLKYFTTATAGFYGIDADGNKETTANTTNYIQFTVYVKSGKNVSKVTPTITITTTKQSTNNGQIALAAGAPVDLGRTFTVDAKYAIYAQQNIGTTTNVFTGGSQLSYVAADATDLSSTQNAHDYWNAVAGKTMDTTMRTSSATDASSSALSDFTLVKNTPLALTYTIFLDGGDTDCFNSCAGWDIAFDLEFSITGSLTD